MAINWLEVQVGNKYRNRAGATVRVTHRDVDGPVTVEIERGPDGTRIPAGRFYVVNRDGIYHDRAARLDLVAKVVPAVAERTGTN